MIALNGGFMILDFINGLIVFGLIRSGSFGSLRVSIFSLIMGK